MKFHQFINLFIFLTSVACARAAEVDCINDNEALLQQLDRAIECKAEYQHRRLVRADSLRALARQKRGTERVSVLKEAYDTYSRFLSDSVFSILNEIKATSDYATDSSLQLWTELCEARNYGVMGLYNLSSDIIRRYDPADLDPDQQLHYYNTVHAVTGWMVDFTRKSAPHLTDSLFRQSSSYLEKVYELEPNEISNTLVYTTMLLEQGRYQQCIDTLLITESRCDQGSAVYLNAIMAQAYDKMGQTDAAIHYLTTTSIHDIEEGVTEYMALQALAERCLEQGQTKRAYQYLICSLEDASICHSNLRMLESTDIFPIIDSAYQTEEKRLRQARIAMFVFGSMCILLIIGFVFYILHSNMKKAQLEALRKKRHLEEISFIANHDELTGLLNRHGGKRPIIKMLRHHVPGYLSILDVDNFKKINDTYGHDVGDKMLQAVARCFSLLPQQTTIRMGGDEFCTYFPNTSSLEEYKQHIEAFFEAIRAINLPEWPELKISVSLGATYYDGRTDSSFEQLYREADKRLYMSKQIKGCQLTV